MSPHPLANFEIQKFYQNGPKFDGIYSRNHLPKISDGAYLINLDEYKSIGAYWIALYVNDNNRNNNDNVTYFDGFGIEHIPKEIKNFIGNKTIITNAYGIQAYE